MWFITYKDLNKKKCFVNKIFENRLDAFRFINDNLNKHSLCEIVVNNGDINLVNDFVIQGSNISFVLQNCISYYGIIDEVSEHLVFVKKDNGDIVEFTKGKLNKYYINGMLCVN